MEKESRFFKKTEEPVKKVEDIEAKEEEKEPEEELIKVGDKQIKLSEAEKKFLKVSEMGATPLTVPLVWIHNTFFSRGETDLSLPELGRGVGKGILRMKHHLQKKWEAFKSRREEPKEEESKEE